MLRADTAAILYQRIREAHQPEPKNHRHAVRDLRLVYESTFNTLTEGTRRGFSTVHARAIFIIKTLQVPANIAGLIHGFRRYGNKVTHKYGFHIQAEHYFSCLEAVARIVSWFSETAIPSDLEELYAGKTGGGFTPYQPPAGEGMEFLRCVVTFIHPMKETQDGTPWFLIEATDLDGELGDFTLSLWKHDHNNLSTLHRLLWPYCTLQIHHIRRQPHAPDAWTTTPSTQVVMEPDQLVDATDVAECFQMQGPNPFAFFLNKLYPSETGIAAFRGTVINDLLDRVLMEPEANIDEVLREAVASKSLTAARYGEEEVTSMLTLIKEKHLPNLQAIARELQGRRVRIEPTFVSADYGLQGRLDALIEDPRDKEHKEIFELKSGNDPNGQGVWPNHQAQVICYHLLLRSAFGPSRHGLCGVFYSGTKGIALRDVSANPWEEHRVLLTRNQVVRGIRDLADGDYWILDKLAPGKIGHLPPYKMNAAHGLQQALMHGRPLDQAWYRHYLSFCLRELLTAKVGGPGDEDRVGHGFAALWLEQREEKARHYAILDGLLVESYDHLNGEITLQVPKGAEHNFREGDIGIIYRDEDLFLHPLQEQILKGGIRVLKHRKLVFTLRNRQLDPETFRKGTRWAIEHDIFETNHWVQIQGMMDFLRAPQAVRDRIMGLHPPASSEPDFREEPGLGPNQNRLLRKALAAHDYFLLQGPPGTGKTSTLLMSIVRRTLEAGKEKIVLLAFTNRAVQEICEKLSKAGMHFLYVGNSNGDGRDSLQVMVREKGIEATRAFIAAQRIYVGTVAGFSTRLGDLSAMTELDLLIVDEASQLTEPALAGLLTRFRKFILIGDQNQLPAVVAQPEARGIVEDEGLRSAGYRHLSESLFGRLYRRAEAMGWSQAFGMLETHFRMHRDIADLINPFYEGRLQSGTDRQAEPFAVFDPGSGDPWERFLAAGRTLFLPSSRVATTKTHQEEATRVAALLQTIRRVYGERFDDRTVGVVTPWRAQIVLIRSLIQDPELLDKVLIDTVERFQGLEKKHILASLAIYHPGQLGALHSPDPENRVDRKLVVTLSRAEEQVVLLGYEPALRQSPFYRPLLERMGRGPI